MGCERVSFYFPYIRTTQRLRQICFIGDVLYRATKYMNVEDILSAREEKPKKRERREDIRKDKGRKMERTRERSDDRRSKPSTRKFMSFTPLITPIDQVLMQIKDE